MQWCILSISNLLCILLLKMLAFKFSEKKIDFCQQICPPGIGFILQEKNHASRVCFGIKMWFLFWLFMVPPSKSVVWMYFLHQYRSAVHQWQAKDVFTCVNTSLYDFHPSVLIYLSPSYVCHYFILFYFYFTWGVPARPTRMYVFLLVKYLLFLLHKWDLCHTGRDGVGKRLESNTCATSTKRHVIHKQDWTLQSLSFPNDPRSAKSLDYVNLHKIITSGYHFLSLN